MTWQRQDAPGLVDQRVFPPIEAGSLKTWIGVGGSPESVVRAARYDLPLMLAIIGGDPAAVQALCRSLPAGLASSSASRCSPSACTRPAIVADTDEQAREELWPDYKRMRDRIGAERGWPPMGRAEFDREADQARSMLARRKRSRERSLRP